MSKNNTKAKDAVNEDVMEYAQQLLKGNKSRTSSIDEGNAHNIITRPDRSISDQIEATAVSGLLNDLLSPLEASGDMSQVLESIKARRSDYNTEEEKETDEEKPKSLSVPVVEEDHDYGLDDDEEEEDSGVSDSSDDSAQDLFLQPAKSSFAKLKVKSNRSSLLEPPDTWETKKDDENGDDENNNNNDDDDDDDDDEFVKRDWEIDAESLQQQSDVVSDSDRLSHCNNRIEN